MKEDRAFEMYTQRGLSARQIAGILGVSATSVRRWLTKRGVELRSAQAAIQLRRNKRFRMTPNTQALLDGLLLGRGRLLAARSGEAWLRISRPAVDLPWLQQVRALLQQRSIHATITASGGRRELNTCRYTGLTAERNRWYPHGEAKRLPEDVMAAPLTIAQWFFGAGGVTRDGYMVRFTMNFPWCDVYDWAERMSKEYGWSPRIHSGLRLALTDRSDIQSLYDIVRRHTPPCFHAKVANLVSANRRPA